MEDLLPDLGSARRPPLDPHGHICTVLSLQMAHRRTEPDALLAESLMSIFSFRFDEMEL
ncbi:Hypothetical protein FKW44_019148 [Caligus rogercresseyi]|uniref:Uncharacterized protein n=1 Tax=Caligus rogercresseyi TaxID=217165 RepID=A0A7T8JYJ8_CALRO|nr:Hypothetical protein FKW44_019148 [Caligus rogercresseyi]